MAEDQDALNESPRDRALLYVVIASYILVAVGVGLIIYGSFASNEILKSILVAFGAALVPAFLLSVFYEHFGRRLLMREFSSRVRSVVQQERSNARVRASGIVDFYKDRNLEEIVPIFARAKEKILLCKTWIPNVDLQYIIEGLQKALTGNPNLDVKILCLDPTSPLAAQRFRDSRDPKEHHRVRAEEGRELIERGLDQIISFCKQNDFYRQVGIRVYRNIPALSLYATEETALIGWYWLEKEAFGGPVLKVEGIQAELSAQARSNFDKMWNRASDYVWGIEGSSVMHVPAVCPPALLKRLEVRRNPAELKEMLEEWPQLMDYGRKIMKFIKNKDQGYCVVRSFPFEGCGPIMQKNLFLMLTCACGTPSNHKRGEEEYICKVTPQLDIHRDIETYSEHDREAPLHTDSHYRERPEEFVAFLMEQQAEMGGRNILLKASWIIKEMKRTEEGRHWLEYLKRHLYPSAEPSRYVETPGKEPTPVKATIINEAETMIRFRLDTIEAGIKQTKSEDVEEKEALAYFCNLVYRSPERRGVTLNNGEMLFVNNYTVLHARTAFEGFPRVLLRIRFNA